MKFLNWLGNKVCLSFPANGEKYAQLVISVRFFAIHGVPLSHAVNKPEKRGIKSLCYLAVLQGLSNLPAGTLRVL